MWFVIPEGVSYVDLGLCASIMNRRAYEQGLDWAVQGFTFHTVNPAVPVGTLTISKLQDTWVTQNAWVKSKALWEEMNDQVLDVEPGIEGKYSDFKVLLEYDMKAAVIQTSSSLAGTILTPYVSEMGTNNPIHTAASYTGGAIESEWEYSTVEIPNDPTSGVTTEYSLHMIGGLTADSKGIIEGYSRSRTRPQAEEPNVPTSESWMNDLFDVGEQLEEIRDDLIADNDRAPYPVGEGANAYYPGGNFELDGLEIHDNVFVTATTVGGKTNMPGGVFRCGMFRINRFLGTEGEPGCVLCVSLVPGKHRGYLAEKVGR